MVNNIKLIEPLLQFPHKDSFYFLQILQRKKDHKGVTLGGSNNNSRLIKAYYITSVDKLHQHEEEIIKLSDLFNARASINLNPRSFEKAAYSVLRKIADQMSNRDFYGVRKAYDSICGEYHSELDKRWLVDIDEPEYGKAVDVANYIGQLQEQGYYKDNPKSKLRKVLSILPSRAGWHIITEPFNLEKWSLSHHKQHEVHKNNPTNLYIP